MCLVHLILVSASHSGNNYCTRTLSFVSKITFILWYKTHTASNGKSFLNSFCVLCSQYFSFPGLSILDYHRGISKSLLKSLNIFSLKCKSMNGIFPVFSKWAYPTKIIPDNILINNWYLWCNVKSNTRCLWLVRVSGDMLLITQLNQLLFGRICDTFV